MGKKLYKADAQGGIGFQSDRKPGEVRVPNYVYDLWMPLLGITDIGVYAVYCRLEMEGVVKKITLDDIAKACRMSKTTLYKINARLMDCGFITIKKPEGHDRAIHMTTEITVHDPPQEVSPDLIKKYQPASGYTPLTPWLIVTDKKPTDVPPSTSHSQSKGGTDYKNGVLPSTPELPKSDVSDSTHRRTEQYAADVPPSTSNVFATPILQPSDIESANAPAPDDIQVEQILKLIPKNPPSKRDVKEKIKIYTFEWVAEAVNKATTKTKPWAYALAVLQGWKLEGKSNTPPTSSAAPSPNGSHPETAVERAQRQQREQYERQKKAG
jgi:hypothetical protein